MIAVSRGAQCSTTVCGRRSGSAPTPALGLGRRARVVKPTARYSAVAAVAVMWTPIRCIRRRVGMAAAPRAATRTVKWQRRNEGLSSLLPWESRALQLYLAVPSSESFFELRSEVTRISSAFPPARSSAVSPPREVVGLAGLAADERLGQGWRRGGSSRRRRRCSR
jgi:hypothetical protein